MDAEFIRTRITELRMKKGESEFQMSLDLGKSKGYIQGISSGKALPSMKQFLNICDYLEISPQEFFNPDPDKTKSINGIYEKLESLDKDDLAAVENLINHLLTKHQND